jgi:aminoglycoside 6'-N-acetyltransferase
MSFLICPMAGFLSMSSSGQTTLSSELTTLRPAAATDARMLAAWHADPDVARYWDGETITPAEIVDRLARDDVAAWIVEAGGEPVGYLQAWWDEEAPRRGGLDGFLVPAARGRGLMPDAARTLGRALLAAGWREVTVDPYAWNHTAVRAWAKAGFAEVSRHAADDEHTAPWVLMRFEL